MVNSCAFTYMIIWPYLAIWQPCLRAYLAIMPANFIMHLAYTFLISKQRPAILFTYLLRPFTLEPLIMTLLHNMFCGKEQGGSEPPFNFRVIFSAPSLSVSLCLSFFPSLNWLKQYKKLQIGKTDLISHTYPQPYKRKVDIFSPYLSLSLSLSHYYIDSFRLHHFILQ